MPPTKQSNEQTTPTGSPTPPAGSAQARKNLFGAAGLVMGAFVLSRLLGLGRVALLGSAFGASSALDAFNAAARVTDTLYILIAGGALGSAFIPTFTAYSARGETQRAWATASAIINLIVVITTVAALITALAAPWLVSALLAPGFGAPVQALTVRLLRIMLASTVIFGVSGLLMGILNANDHFLLPALAPSLYNLGIMGGIVIGARRWGVQGAAVGTVVGAALHLLIQLPALLKLDWTYLPTLGLRMNGVRQVGRLMAPRVLGLAVTQLNFWVNTNLGSRIPAAGVVTALTFGWQLMLLPHGIFAQAIATVLLPSFSAQAARKEHAAFQNTLLAALRAVFYLSLPATVGLILLREQFVEMLFMRGAFDRTDVAMAAWALAWYAAGLVAHSELEIVTRAFYALHDTATPVWVGGGAMALNVALSLLLRWAFERLGIGNASWAPLGGLALANSIATALETLALSAILYRRLGGWDHRTLSSSAWRTTASTLVMGGALWLWLRATPHSSPWIAGAGGVLLGGAAFLLTSALVRSPELSLARSALRNGR